MPEGPECFKTAVKLHRLLSGRSLFRINLISGRYVTHGPPDNFDVLSESIANGSQKVESVWSKGKLIIFRLSSDFYLFSTLGLMGKWSQKQSKHTSISIEYVPRTSSASSRNTTTKQVFFTDQLHYGTLSIGIGTDALDKKLKALGVDVLDESAFTWERFKAICQKNNKKTFIDLLMNQKQVCGIGNYLKCEILYVSRASIASPISDYTDEQLNSVYQACKTITRLCTFGKYRLQVYGRKRDPDGHQVFRVKTSDKRTTHWVPSVMPLRIEDTTSATRAVRLQSIPTSATVQTLGQASCDSDILHEQGETEFAEDLYDISSAED